MDLDYFKIFATISLSVIGWLIGHYFNSTRDVANKRRELTIQHLIQAYHIITNDIAHRNESVERSLKLERILSEIQLFGSQEQINHAKKLADEVASGGVFELDPLINSLRNDLRKQLKLPAVSGNVKWLRFDDSTVVK